MRRPVKTYEEAVMTWFEKRAGVPSWYGGGVDQSGVSDLFDHVRRCGQRFPSAPEIGYYEEFGGHDEPASRVSAVVIDVACKCGRVRKSLAVKPAYRSSISDL